MKKLIFIFMAFIAVNSFATSSHVFNLDQNSIDQEFAQLSSLEDIVLNDVSINLSTAIESDLISDSFNTNMNMSSINSDLNFEIGGFLWGFLCCPIGLFTVALNDDKSSDQKTSYWIGVAAGVVLSAITSPVYL